MISTRRFTIYFPQRWCIHQCFCQEQVDGSVAIYFLREAATPDRNPLAWLPGGKNKSWNSHPRKKSPSRSPAFLKAIRTSLTSIRTAIRFASSRRKRTNVFHHLRKLRCYEKPPARNRNHSMHRITEQPVVRRMHWDQLHSNGFYSWSLHHWWIRYRYANNHSLPSQKDWLQNHSLISQLLKQFGNQKWFNPLFHDFFLQRWCTPNVSVKSK